MGLIQRAPLLLHAAAPGTPPGLQHPELLWMGLGVLLGFFLVSTVFGTLETIRGNSPDAYKEALERHRNCEAAAEALKAKIENLETAIKTLRDEVTQKDTRIQDLNSTVGPLNTTIEDRGREIELLNQTIRGRDGTI